MSFKIKNKKAFWCFLITTQLVILCVACVIYSRREIAELNYTQDDLVYNNGESGFYLDLSYDYSYVSTPEFTLPKGLYTVNIVYENSGELTSTVEIRYSDERFDSNVSGKIILSGNTEASCDFRVKYDNRPIEVRARLTGDAGEGDYILIRNMEIYPSSYAMKNFLFRIILLFFVLDGLLILYMMKDKFSISNESINHIKILLLLIVFSNIPLMINYLFAESHDLLFHLMRIEGLKAGLESGIFPVKIQPAWIGGHGYAVSIFYGDFFLYIPALLRTMGISIQVVYKLYVILVNTATVLISYYCFSKMSNNRIGLVCSIFYSLNIYRLLSVYTRGAVGEYTAMVFMPFVLYGLWKIYTLPEESKEHRSSWIPLTVGCSGIFLSHMITTEITAFFIVLTCAILFRRTFRKKTFSVLIKAAMATVCLNLWFLVPFLDYMLTGQYVINNLDSYAAYRMEDRGLFIAQFFLIDYSTVGESRNNLSGIPGEMPLTVGCAALFVLAGWFYLCLWRKEREAEEKKKEYFAVFLCFLSLLMTTYFVPYSWIVNKIPILTNVIRSIQFTWRFLTVAALMITYLLCLILQKKWIETNKKKLFVLVLCCLSFAQGLSYMSKCLNEFSVMNINYAGNVSTYYVSGGEYIPAGCLAAIKKGKYMNHLTYDENEVQIDEWHRDKAAVVVSLTNNTDSESMVEVPLILYKGYHAYADTKEELTIIPGESYRVAVAVPAGFSGSFRVEFKEPWYWRVCELISLFSLVGGIFYMVKGRSWKKVSN